MSLGFMAFIRIVRAFFFWKGCTKTEMMVSAWDGQRYSLLSFPGQRERICAGNK